MVLQIFRIHQKCSYHQYSNGRLNINHQALSNLDTGERSNSYKNTLSFLSYILNGTVEVQVALYKAMLLNGKSLYLSENIYEGIILLWTRNASKSNIRC